MTGIKSPWSLGPFYLWVSLQPVIPCNFLPHYSSLKSLPVEWQDYCPQNLLFLLEMLTAGEMLQFWGLTSSAPPYIPPGVALDVITHFSLVTENPVTLLAPQLGHLMQISSVSINSSLRASFWPTTWLIVYKGIVEIVKLSLNRHAWRVMTSYATSLTSHPLGYNGLVLESSRNRDESNELKSW